MKRFEYDMFDVLFNWEKDGEREIIWKGTSLPYDTYILTLLKKYGNEGWEMIGITPFINTNFENAAILPFRADTVVPYVYTAVESYYFKREVSDESTSEISEEEMKLYENLLEIEKNVYRQVSDEEEETAPEVMPTPTRTAKDIIKEYTQKGYYLRFEHKERLEFERGNEIVRFDRDRRSGEWIQKQVNTNNI